MQLLRHIAVLALLVTSAIGLLTFAHLYAPGGESDIAKRCAQSLAQSQWPKWIGCTMAAHENLAGGLIGAVGALFAAWLAWTLVQKQLEDSKLALVIANRSAKATEDTVVGSQRPWLSVDIALVSDVTFSPEGELRVTIAFTLRNKGNSPALNALVSPVLVPFMTSADGPAISRLRPICDAEKRRPDENAVLGHTIFPGDEFVYSVNLGMPRDVYENALPEAGLLDHVIPVLLGCASYRFPFQPGRHVTEFVADIRKRNPQLPNSPGGFFPAHGNVSVNEVVLVRSFVGGNAD